MQFDHSNLEEGVNQAFKQVVDAVCNREPSAGDAAIEDLLASFATATSQDDEASFQLVLQASQHEANGNWHEAEAAYRQILVLPDIGRAEQYKTQADLAALCRLMDRPLDALEHAQQATKAAKDVNESVLFPMACVSEAHLYLELGNVDQAQSCVDLALSSLGDDGLLNHFRAHLLTLRAECHLHQGDIITASHTLEEAHVLLEPIVSPSLAAGILNSQRHWWRVVARLRTAQGANAEAVVAWKRAVAIGRQIHSLPHVRSPYTAAALAETLSGLARALQLAKREGEAAVVDSERQALQHEAHLPPCASPHVP